MNLWLDELIDKARNGDELAARVLAGYLAECLEKGEVPSALITYFVPLLKHITKGRSADKELNLGTSANFKRDCDIARAVWKLNGRPRHHPDKLPLRDSIDKTGAYSVVAKQYGLTADGIEKIYKKMRWLIDAEILLMFEPEDRPSEPDIPPEHEAEWRAVQHQDTIDWHSILMRLSDLDDLDASKK